MSGIDAMSQLKMALGEPAARIVGWTLLHFVWQGALIGALTAAALAVLRRSAADVRYVVATVAMSLMLMMPLMTATELWRAAASERGQASATRATETWNAAMPDAGVETALAATRADALTPTTLTTAAVAAAERVRIEPWLPMLVLAWLSGVVMLSLRLMSGWLWVQRMKSHGTVAAEVGWQYIAARLSRRLHIGRPVTLLQSALVDVPTVIGWMKPVILLPASALAGLTPHQLEAILAHELAHIRRHDYLVNLGQTLVETLLFYHPAVWWLSRRIRVERENCCDDLAVSLCGDPYTYAKALADLEELRGVSGRLVMAASGGSLVQRVRRLLGAPTHAGPAPGWLAGSAAIVVMFGLAAGAVGTDAFHTASAPAPQIAVVEADRAPADAREALAAMDAGRPAATTPVLPAADASLVEVGEALDAVQAAQSSALPARAETLPEIPTGSPGRGQSTGTISGSKTDENLEIQDVEAARSPDSDFERRRMYTAALKRGPVSAPVLADILEGSLSIDSDFELASLLTQIATRQPLDNTTRQAFFAALATVDSDFEHRRVLEALAGRGDLSPETTAAMLASVRGISSDFEAAEFLQQIGKDQPIEGTLRAPFFKAVESIDSDFERGRVLKALVKRPDVSPLTIVAAIGAVRTMDGSHEASKVLLAIAAAHRLSGEARDAYTDAARNLADFEQGKVLEALARNERRR